MTLVNGTPESTSNALQNCTDLAGEGKEETKVVRQLVLTWIQKATTAQINLQEGITRRTALHRAAYWGDTQIVRALLKKGARNDISVPPEWTPGVASDYARLLGHNELAYEIEGRDFSEYKRTLNYAVQQNDFARVRSLIASGAKVTDPDRASKLTALHYAVQAGNLKMVQLLVEAGADIDALNFKQWSPLTIALQDRKREIVTYLVHAGASANHGVNAGCTTGRTEFWYLVTTAYQNPAFYSLAAIEVKRNAILWPDEAIHVGYLHWDHEGAPELIEALVNKGAPVTQEQYDSYKKNASPEVFRRIKPFLDKGLNQRLSTRAIGRPVRDPKDARPLLDLDRNGMLKVNALD